MQEVLKFNFSTLLDFVTLAEIMKPNPLSTVSEVLEARLAREATVLIEKDAGVNNILVQLGRDTAIIEAHKLMLKQQQDKVAQIQQVT